MVRFELSEVATDFAVGDVTVTNGVLSAFSGSGKSYTGVFTPGAGVTGEGRIRVEANRFTDGAGNGNLAGELRLTADVAFAWEVTPHQVVLVMAGMGERFYID